MSLLNIYASNSRFNSQELPKSLNSLSVLISILSKRAAVDVQSCRIWTTSVIHLYRKLFMAIKKADLRVADRLL